MKIGIIGGGASGMMAAISAVRRGAEVTILEGGDRIGKKILATGNGKCNFTNKKMDNICFRSNTISDVSSFLTQFGTEETLKFFSELQMLYKDKNGYYYPASEQASTVLDVLRYTLEEFYQKVMILTSHKVNKLTYMDNGCVKVYCGSEAFLFDRVILTCGSKASPKTGSDGSGYRLIRSLNLGCSIEEVVPALVQLRCREDYVKAVAGVRAEGRVSLEINGRIICEDTGEVQLTEYGISGIPVFQVSRFASYGCLRGHEVLAHLDFMPDMTEDSFTEYMFARKKALSDRTMDKFCSGLLNKKISTLFCKMAGISLEKRVSEVSGKKFLRFVGFYKNWILHIEQPNGFDMAQVCAGGLSMQEINEHFALKKCPSVYAAGELLDVDGICGGYNLQWAWTSGYLAGQYAALD